MANEPIKPKTVSLPRYVSIMEERVEKARPPYFFVRTQDVQPAKLTDGIHVSLDGIVTRSDVTTHTYPFQDPGSRFLEKALTNHGYVASAAHYFTNGKGVDHARFELFIEGFNANMEELMTIHHISNPNGHLLLRNPTNGQYRPNGTLTIHDLASDLSLRPQVPKDTAGYLETLRDLSEHLRESRRRA